jgi:hypothetical protein
MRCARTCNFCLRQLAQTIKNSNEQIILKTDDQPRYKEVVLKLKKDIPLKWRNLLDFFVLGIAAAVATLVGYTTGLLYGSIIRVYYTGLFYGFSLRVLSTGSLYGFSLRVLFTGSL